MVVVINFFYLKFNFAGDSSCAVLKQMRHYQQKYMVLFEETSGFANGFA